MDKTHDGLIVICGVTGSGKSSTLAAMINHINKTRQVNIITIEDPIEYAFHSDKSYISQREIGIDVPRTGIPPCDIGETHLGVELTVAITPELDTPPAVIPEDTILDDQCELLGAVGGTVTERTQGHARVTTHSVVK